MILQRKVRKTFKTRAREYANALQSSKTVDKLVISSITSGENSSYQTGSETLPCQLKFLLQIFIHLDI